MNGMKYLVTKEIDSPAKVTKNVTAFDFFFVLGYVGLTIALQGAVHSSLKIPYFLFSAAMAVFLTSRSSFNRRRRNYESVILLLQKDNQVYRPICAEEERKQHEQKKEE